MALNLVHEAAYHNGPFNSQYVTDYEHESLIFAVGSEVRRSLSMTSVSLAPIDMLV